MNRFKLGQMASKSRSPAAVASGVADRLARIEAAVDPDDAQWIRSLAEAIDRRGQRDAAIRSAAALVPGSSVSRKAKSLEQELRRYLGGAWLRERHLPPADASPLRRELHRIARLTGGDGLGWRRLVEIIEA
jgi:hypothetical protein